ncbi:MAG: SIMPL domain-containing protein [Bacteroidales bacterium]|nr:SIMPL domain-containing protein [Bacteroidales bacterium]
MKKTKIITAIIFGVAFVGGLWIAGHYLYKAKGQPKTVSVVGMAERDFDSDLIVWDISFDVLNYDIKSGYAELKDVTKEIKKYLIEQGITENEMDFRAVTNYKETEYEYNNETHTSRDIFKGYRLTQRVRIESGNVEKIEKVQRQISELLDRGINIEDNGMSYYYTKLADLKVEMLAEATENARNRAETIAKNAGSRLGGLKVANMGVFQITAPNSTDEDYSWGGAFNTSSKKKRVSINMRLTYYVK